MCYWHTVGTMHPDLQYKEKTTIQQPFGVLVHNHGTQGGGGGTLIC